MKINIFLFLIILFSKILFAQEKGWWPVEIFMLTQGLDGDSVRYELEASGTVWDSLSSSSHSITTSYDEALYPLVDSLPEPNLPPDWYYQDVWGFNRVGSSFSGYPTYGYGLYKVSVTPGNAYFYLDYRDTEVGKYQQVSAPADIWIMYNDTLGVGDNGKFFYRSTGTTNLDTSNWTGINNGDYIEFWKIKNQSNPEISDFVSYWSNALCLIEQDGHPLLVWGPHPTIENIEHYNLYRKKSTEQNFSEIYQTEDDDTTYFLDEDIDILTGPYQQNEISAEYYVTASYHYAEELNETNPTNTVEVERAEGEPLKKLNGNQTQHSLKTVEVFRIYPNPFNPKTNIEYTIFEESFVKVDIYNVLGVKVLTLGNEYKFPGTYKLVFDGTKFSSGIYYCRINIGSFNTIKKVVLIK